MSVIAVTIKLDRPNRTYFTGELIKGMVIVKNDTETTLKLAQHKRMIIVFRGGAMTNLHGKQLARLPTEQLRAMALVSSYGTIGRVSYLDQILALTPDDGSEVEIVAGANGFPFEFQLPNDLPTSFAGSSSGGVQYYTNAIVYLEGIPVYFSARTNFSIINCLDLNLNPLASQKSYYSFEKLIWVSGSGLRASPRRRSSNSLLGRKCVNVIVKVAKEGYVGGEMVQLVLQLLNCVSREFTQLELELVQEILYNCPAGSYSEARQIRSTAIESSANVCDCEFTCSIDIPSGLIPSTTSTSALIRVSYAVLIKLKLSHSGGIVDIGKIPILIGTVGIRQIEWNYSGDENQSEIDGEQPSTSAGALRRLASRREQYRRRILEFLDQQTNTRPSAPMLASSEDFEEPAAAASAQSQGGPEVEVEPQEEDQFPPSYNEVMGIGLATAAS